MSDERVFDTDSLKPGTPTAGQPPRPSGPLPEDAYTVEVLRTLADGTSTLNSATQISRYPSELRSASFPLDAPPVLSWADAEALAPGGRIELDAFAEALGRPLAIDVAEGAAALATAPADQAAQMANLEAPDFTLPDLEGTLHSLSEHRGKKVLLIAYASW